MLTGWQEAVINVLDVWKMDVSSLKSLANETVDKTTFTAANEAYTDL